VQLQHFLGKQEQVVPGVMRQQMLLAASISAFIA
jgi:hypothetical protein